MTGTTVTAALRRLPMSDFACQFEFPGPLVPGWPLRVARPAGLPSHVLVLRNARCLSGVACAAGHKPKDASRAPPTMVPTRARPWPCRTLQKERSGHPNRSGRESGRPARTELGACTRTGPRMDRISASQPHEDWSSGSGVGDGEAGRRRKWKRAVELAPVTRGPGIRRAGAAPAGAPGALLSGRDVALAGELRCGTARPGSGLGVSRAATTVALEARSRAGAVMTAPIRPPAESTEHAVPSAARQRALQGLDDATTALSNVSSRDRVGAARPGRTRVD